MKINWAVRLKNPVFWATVIPSVLAIIYDVLAWFGISPPVSIDSVLSMISNIFKLLGVLGIIVDMTTAGIGDSNRALGYETPHRDYPYQ